MKAQFTPGPWVVACESGNPGEAFVIEAGTRTVAWTANTIGPEDDEVITSEDRANARLIEQAPKLYELARRAADAIADMRGADDPVTGIEHEIATCVALIEGREG